ncbi:MAG: hypothetical protein IJO32_00675 [Bacilli bacterium]|nr:hypothetical protein [Bacilli bacterium]
MKEYTLKIDFNNQRIIPNQEIELVQNDYNSTKFNFIFDDEYSNYTKVFELKYPSSKKWIKEIINDELILANYDEDGNIIPILIEVRDYEFEVVLYDENSKLTNFATGKFFVRPELVNPTDEEIELETEYPILDQLIQETTALKEGYEKVVEQGNYAEEQGNYAKKEATKVDGVVDYVVTTSEEAKENSETAISISKGANQSKGYKSYRDLVTAFNVLPSDTYRVGQNLYVKTKLVPDLWVYEVFEESIPYTYTNDEDFVALVDSEDGIRIGHYSLGPLETQKVDLTDYVQFTDVATSTKAGVVKMWTSTNEDGEIGLNISTEV